MTDLEKRAITSLRSVKMPVQNWHARCVKRLFELMASYPDSRLHAPDAADLWFLVWRYRRQVTDVEVVAKADEIVNGALHLEFEISL